MTGEGQAYDDCGSFLRGFACPAAVGRSVQTTLGGLPGAHYSKAVRKTCGRLECPSCWVSAARRAGERVDGVLAACRDLFDLATPRHFAFSPPPVGPESWAHRFAAAATEEEFEDVERRFRVKANRLMQRAGLVAGAVVVHVWRCDQKDGGGERYHQGARYLSPHVHVLGFGRTVPFEEFRKMSRGWLYVNLDEKMVRGRVRRVRRRDVVDTTAYLLGHVGVYGDTRRVAYFGLASPRSMVIDREVVERTPVVCPCSSPVHVYDVVDVPDVGPCIDWSQPRGEAYTVTRTRTYRRRDAPREAAVRVVDDDLVDVCVRCGCRRDLCAAGATSCSPLVL